MARSLLALFLALAAVTTTTYAVDPMFAADGTLAHRVALETGVSDACAAALLCVENEFADKEVVGVIDRVCHEEVEDAITSGDFTELSPDGLIAIYLNGVTLFVGVRTDGDGAEPAVFDLAPGRFSPTRE